MSIDDLTALENNMNELKSYLSKESGKREKIIEEINDSSKKIAEINTNIDLLERAS